MQKLGTTAIEISSLPQQNKHNSFAELSESLRRLLFFAKPDLVICMDDGGNPIHPIFAFELTTHVPARDHWMQRFVNLVGCAQEGIPGTYIMPFSMLEREKFKGEIDPIFFFAYDRVMEIHQIPFYIADWKTLDGKILSRDKEFSDMPDSNSKGLQNAFSFLDLVIDSAIHGRGFSNLIKDRLLVDLRNQIRKLAFKDIPQIKQFNRLCFNMPRHKFLTLKEVKAWIESKQLKFPSDSDLPDRIRKRKKNLIYVPQSEQGSKTQKQLRKSLLERIKDKGGDPYLGQPLAFDYLFCRLGSSPYERDVNLIIDLSVLKFSDLSVYHREVWEKCPLQFKEIGNVPHIPRYTMYLTKGCPNVTKNFLRVYAFAADIIVFKDGLIYF